MMEDGRGGQERAAWTGDGGRWGEMGGDGRELEGRRPVCRGLCCCNIISKDFKDLPATVKHL